MDSFLITGHDEKKLKKRAFEMAKDYQASSADTLLLKPEEKTAIIYINEVRELKRKLSLKPFNSPCKVAIIHQVQKATLEAQNALLKLLEEPPNNTYIILTANRQEELLPTVVSRCQVIKIPNSKFQVPSSKFPSHLQLLNSIFQGGVGERLVIAQNLSASRQEAIAWCQKTILVLKEVLISKIQNPKSKTEIAAASFFSKEKGSREAIKQGTSLIRKLQKALKVLQKTNTNVRLLMENLLLEFPK